MDGSMILIKLDGRITVPQIVDAIDAQPRQGADVLIDRIQLRWRPRSTTSAAKNHWGGGPDHGGCDGGV